jgi:hypothetical protein
VIGEEVVGQEPDDDHVGSISWLELDQVLELAARVECGDARLDDFDPMALFAQLSLDQHRPDVWIFFTFAKREGIAEKENARDGRIALSIKVGGGVAHPLAVRRVQHIELRGLHAVEVVRTHSV